MNSPRAEGLDFRWNESTMATDTIAMYTLSFSHERNAVGFVSQQIIYLIGRVRTAFIRSMISRIRGDIVKQQASQPRRFSKNNSVVLVVSAILVVFCTLQVGEMPYCLTKTGLLPKML